MSTSVCRRCGLSVVWGTRLGRHVMLDRGRGLPDARFVLVAGRVMTPAELRLAGDELAGEVDRRPLLAAHVCDRVWVQPGISGCAECGTVDESVRLVAGSWLCPEHDPTSADRMVR